MANKVTGRAYHNGWGKAEQEGLVRLAPVYRAKGWVEAEFGFPRPPKQGEWFVNLAGRPQLATRDWTRPLLICERIG